MRFHWGPVRTVFLDMDGTLLDLYFDNYFWQEYVPDRYAELRGISAVQARDELRGRYKSMRGTLQWYCVEFWTEELGLDIAALKREVAHLIAMRPSVAEFLAALRASGKRTVLLTNAHRMSVELKFEHVELAPYFDRVISSHDYGLPKETAAFWKRLMDDEFHNPAETLLIDDSENVLAAARKAGVAHLLSIAKPDSSLPPQTTMDFLSIEDFRDLLPII